MQLASQPQMKYKKSFWLLMDTCGAMFLVANSWSPYFCTVVEMNDYYSE